MNESELRLLGPTLDRYLERFLFCCAYTQTFAHLGTYVRGLLSQLPRKSVEPLALAAGTPVRTLQEFLKDHLWCDAQLRCQLQGHIAGLLGQLPDPDDLGTIGIVDETSAVKCGTRTPGVQRQYLGCVGKIQNGIVTVHLGVCKGPFKALLDADLFLPRSWDQDRDRCRAAGIPDEVTYRPEWQIALEQLGRAGSNGVVVDGLTFDEGYGCCPSFLAGLSQRRQRFIGEVPRTFACLAAHKSGRRPPEGAKGRAACEVVRHSSVFPSGGWQLLRLSRRTLAEALWRFKGARVWVSSKEGWLGGPYWLVWASNDGTGEEKFFLSNGDPQQEGEWLLRVAFRRYQVEHSFRLCKGELGFTHYEGRSYGGLMRHMSLGLVALAFCAEHTERLRGGKRGDHGGAGVPLSGVGV